MSEKIICPRDGINGTIMVPGDKSISHRAVMFGAIAEGVTEIDGFLPGEDCLSTIDCFRRLGVEIEAQDERVRVHGRGLRGLRQSDSVLDCGNSGTTMRLMTGILSGQSFDSEMTGDASIQKRPMGRVLKPLREMGARAYGKDGDYAPIRIEGTALNGIRYDMPVASAQVKSALLLAGLYAKDETIIREPAPCRDHTELMLREMGADIVTDGNTITCRPCDRLRGGKITVPGDISSAAFFLTAALILPGSRLVIKNVGINKTRTGVIDALRKMGGSITLLNERKSGGEPVADIEVSSSSLKGITISGEIIPRMIDEIPVFAVAALFAKGVTVIKDAGELRVKESDRILTMTEELTKMGGKVTPTEDGMIIEGGHPLTGAQVNSYNDHRVAMSLAVAGLAAKGKTVIQDSECADISFPGFYELLIREGMGYA